MNILRRDLDSGTAGFINGIGIETN